MNSSVLNRFINNDIELSPHRNYIDKLVKPSVDISIKSEIAKDHESKFAGRPVVPQNFVWPEHKDGEYKFLGQINFAEIKSCPEILPKYGMLSLFYAYDEDGEIFWQEDGYVKGYYWPQTEKLIPYEAMKSDKLQSRKMELCGGIEIPRLEYLRNDWPFNPDILCVLPELEGYREDYMLGYPSFCTLVYDPTPGVEWVSLLTLASYRELGWRWHDGDKLMVFIEKEKLLRKDFSNLKTDAG